MSTCTGDSKNIENHIFSCTNRQIIEEHRATIRTLQFMEFALLQSFDICIKPSQSSCFSAQRGAIINYFEMDSPLTVYFQSSHHLYANVNLIQLNKSTSNYDDVMLSYIFCHDYSYPII